MKSSRPLLYGLVAVALLSCAALAGCGGSGSGVTPVPIVHRVLALGSPSGAAMDAIRTRYAVASGTGAEDPSSYDMLVVDASSSDPVALQQTHAMSTFLAQGKIVVVLNSTDAQRDTILKGHLFAHARGNLAAAAYYIPAPGRALEVDFPVHLAQEPSTGCAFASTNPCPVALVTPPPATLAADATQWLDQVQQRFISGAGSVIPSPSPQPGQAALNLDIVQPFSFQIGSAVNDMTPGSDGFFGHGDGYWCNANQQCGWQQDPTANQPSIFNTVTGTFESSVAVLLEPNGGSFQHKVILRQYSLVSPQVLGSGWQYPYYEEAYGLVNGYPDFVYRTLTTTLGFNTSTWLRAGPDGNWQSQYPMGLTLALPANANNTSTLTTSYTHTEGVALSATAQTDKVATVGANWSDQWAWQSLHTINISDWTVQQSGDVQYVYTGSGNTPDTYDRLVTYQRQYTPDGTYDLANGINALNSLQQGNMTAESESDWVSSGGPVGPVEETLQSSTELVQGEVYTFQHCNTTDYGQKNCEPSYYSNTPSYQYTQNIAIDFATPTLQPPTQAPFTLSFSPWPDPMPDQATITGTLRIPSPAQNPGPVQLSYIVEPLSPVLTVPSGNVCPGNQYAFNPGNTVISNGSPPFSVTIPIGQTSATFQITVQTLQQPYNVQVVAWQYAGTLNGLNVPNLESAWCLTVPGPTP